MLDIFIIGGGPIGLTCGLAAQKAGLSFVIVEKGTLVNSLYNYPATMTFFSTSEKLEIGGAILGIHSELAESLKKAESQRQLFSFDSCEGSCRLTGQI